MTALHGFLGRGGDWDGVLPAGWHCPDWLRHLRDADNLDDIARRLNAAATGDILLGYSMGGRIALHMVLADPTRWRKTIIVSASPGLADPEERSARIANDLRWAERFRHEDWATVVDDWNAQPVFRHDPPDRLNRLEADFDRELLALALEVGSVGRQRDLRPELAALDAEILWIAGAKDAKYAAMAEACAAINPRFSFRILDAGHRVPWGATDEFRNAIREGTQYKP